ncbi:MAG: hypothetical protein SOX26_06170 [Phocaeicola sp.]|nr:hypothetical protein [Phocaeicola sp.]
MAWTKSDRRLSIRCCLRIVAICATRQPISNTDRSNDKSNASAICRMTGDKPTAQSIRIYSPSNMSYGYTTIRFLCRNETLSVRMGCHIIESARPSSIFLTSKPLCRNKESNGSTSIGTYSSKRKRSSASNTSLSVAVLSITKACFSIPPGCSDS